MHTFNRLYNHYACISAFRLMSIYPKCSPFDSAAISLGCKVTDSNPKSTYTLYWESAGDDHVVSCTFLRNAAPIKTFTTPENDPRAVVQNNICERVDAVVAFTLILKFSLHFNDAVAFNVDWINGSSCHIAKYSPDEYPDSLQLSHFASAPCGKCTTCILCLNPNYLIVSQKVNADGFVIFSHNLDSNACWPLK